MRIRCRGSMLMRPLVVFVISEGRRTFVPICQTTGTSSFKFLQIIPRSTSFFPLFSFFVQNFQFFFCLPWTWEFHRFFVSAIHRRTLHGRTRLWQSLHHRKNPSTVVRTFYDVSRPVANLENRLHLTFYLKRSSPQFRLETTVFCFSFLRSQRIEQTDLAKSFHNFCFSWTDPLYFLNILRSLGRSAWKSIPKYWQNTLSQ